MIYSKRLQKYVPVRIEKQSYNLRNFGVFTKYRIFDGKMPVGFVDLKDTPKGVQVEFIKNQYPEFYSNFGHLADQIEVEHCLNRGLDTFEITSEASLNSHAKHYIRGKRFSPETINDIVKNIILKTPKNKDFDTKFLGKVNMYMPQNMILKILKKIKTNPLL